MAHVVSSSAQSYFSSRLHTQWRLPRWIRHASIVAMAAALLACTTAAQISGESLDSSLSPAGPPVPSPVERGPFRATSLSRSGGSTAASGDESDSTGDASHGSSSGSPAGTGSDEGKADPSAPPLPSSLSSASALDSSLPSSSSPSSSCSRSASAGADLEPPAATPTTTTTTAAPAAARRIWIPIKLAALATLIVPVGVLGYVGSRLLQRYRHRRLERQVRLAGSAGTGVVDDVELGHALSGGDWLTKRAGGSSGAIGGGGGDLKNTVAVPIDEFDPIADQAEAQRQKRARRRQYADNGEALGNDIARSGGAANGIDSIGNVMEGDEEDDEDGEDGFSRGADGAARPIYAATMTTDQPLLATEEQLPTTPAPVMSRIDGVTGGAAGSGGAAGGRYYDPSAYALANQMLLERYADVDATETRGAQQPQLQQPQHSYQHRRQESSAFEHILSTAVAPIEVGVEYHQRGGGGGGAVAAASSSPQKMYSPTEGPEDDDEEEFEEEEDAEEGDEEGVEEDEEDSDALNLR